MEMIYMYTMTNNVKSPLVKELQYATFFSVSFPIYKTTQPIFKSMHMDIFTCREYTSTILCLVLIIEMPSTAWGTPHYHIVGFGVGFHTAVQHLTSARNKI